MGDFYRTGLPPRFQRFGFGFAVGAFRRNAFTQVPDRSEEWGWDDPESARAPRKEFLNFWFF